MKGFICCLKLGSVLSICAEILFSLSPSDLMSLFTFSKEALKKIECVNSYSKIREMVFKNLGKYLLLSVIEKHVQKNIVCQNLEESSFCVCWWLWFMDLQPKTLTWKKPQKSATTHEMIIEQRDMLSCCQVYCSRRRFGNRQTLGPGL